MSQREAEDPVGAGLSRPKGAPPPAPDIVIASEQERDKPVPYACLVGLPRVLLVLAGADPQLQQGVFVGFG